METEISRMLQVCLGEMTNSGALSSLHGGLEYYFIFSFQLATYR